MCFLSPIQFSVDGRCRERTIAFAGKKAAKKQVEIGIFFSNNGVKTQLKV